jgi:hypothetical protein
MRRIFFFSFSQFDNYKWKRASGRAMNAMERNRQTPFFATLAEWIAVDFLGT